MNNKSNHQANIVRITELLPHTNADTLELIHIGDYQVVVKKGQFKPGNLAVYIQPDSIVPQTEPFKFIWAQYAEGPQGCKHERRVPHETLAHKLIDLCLSCNAVLVNGVMEVPEKRRRITVRKFRGEWSEGLIMPLSDFIVPNATCLNENGWNEGDDVAELIGITHYDPDRGKENTGDNAQAPRHRSRWPRSWKGWLYFLLSKLGIKLNSQTDGWDRGTDIGLPIYDIEALKNHSGVLIEGEPVIVTEKIHGSNARFVFLDGTMHAGSRTLWKSPKSSCIWRKALAQNTWIERWCREHEGYALYGEVVPTQKGFTYGCKEGEVKFFVFDIRTPDGNWQELTENM